MEANAIETFFMPYTRFAQANAELLKKLPQAPSVAPQSYTSVQDSVSASADAAATLPSVYADLALQWMRNWTTLWTELSQTMLALFSQGQEAWLEQARDAARAASQPSDATQERTRRTRTAH
jgi:hypothetical protein